MLHHVDVHVRNLAKTRALFDSFVGYVGYRSRERDPDDGDQFAGYEPASGGRPRLGLIGDGGVRSGSTRIAFSAASRADVGAAASAIVAQGARAVEGPSSHPEYGGDYYAVFFEDEDGNRYEIVAPTGNP